MTGFGMPGVWTWDFGEGFAHLYLDSVAHEPQLHRPRLRDLRQWHRRDACVRTVAARTRPRREWYRALPPPAEPFRWSARDNVNYNETGALAALDAVAAAKPRRCSRNFYRRAITPGARAWTRRPYAFVIPDGQGDPTRVAQLVARLLAQHIEVHRATAPLVLKEGTFPAGTYVVRLDQPYRNYAVDLLTPQQYPKDSRRALRRRLVGTAGELSPAGRCATADPRCAGESGRADASAACRRAASRHAGRYYVLKDTGQEGLLEARYRLAAIHDSDRRTRVHRRWQSTIRPARGFSRRSRDWRRPLRDTARATWARFRRVAAAAGRARATPRRRRGWACGCRGRTPTRSAGCATRSINAISRTATCATRTFAPGNLHDKYDVLLYGHVDLELAEQIHGHPEALGSDAVQEDRADAELRHAGGIRRHHRRHRLERAWPRSSDSSSAAACWSRSAVARCWRSRAASCAACDAIRRPAAQLRRAAAPPPRPPPRQPTPHARRACARDLCAAGSPDRLWLSGAHLRLSPEFPAVCGAAPLAADGLLHDLPRWAV